MLITTDEGDNAITCVMVRAKGTPRKVEKRRVVLQPAPALSGAALDAALLDFANKAPAMQAAANAKRKRRAPRRKKPKSPEFVITKADERLIEEAAQLQHANRKSRRRAPVKRTAPKKKASLGFDRRTTLLSLVRRIPDAKKPITQWLK